MRRASVDVVIPVVVHVGVVVDVALPLVEARWLVGVLERMGVLDLDTVDVVGVGVGVGVAVILRGRKVGEESYSGKEGLHLSVSGKNLNYC